MEYHLRTKLNGNIAMTSCFHENSFLQRDRSLYKFIWVRHGTLDVEVDHVVMHLEKEEMISLTPLHHVQIRGVGGEYLTFLFNSNFYCIYRHDSEVSCNGFLFNGSSRVMRLKLSPSQSARLDSIVDIFRGECGIQDNLQEEMLRIILKRFIITCTRIAREKFDVDPGRENMFDVIRQFYVLVDSHFKEKKQVQDYADMLCRSPKTISNLFSLYGLSSPLRVIHERVDAEAKRLLLYTGKSANNCQPIWGNCHLLEGENHRPLHQEVKSFNNESNDGKIKISVCCVFNNSSICPKTGYQSYPCGNPCNFCMDWWSEILEL